MTKKIISFLLCLITLISLVIPVVSSQAHAATTWTDTCEYVATTTNLNVRTGPGLSYDRITTVKKDYQVLRIGTGSNGWSKVIVKGTVAYMNSSYLKTTTYKTSRDVSSTAVSGVTFTRLNETIKANSKVKVRKGPGTTYDMLGRLNTTDTYIRIGMSNNGWSQIIYNNKVAYVNSNYVSSAQSNINSMYKAITNLNIRTGPSTSYKKIGTLKFNDTILSLGIENGWHKFKFNDQIAYSNGAYLAKIKGGTTPIPPQDEYVPAPPVRDNTYYVTTNLNVRAAPSASDRLLGLLKKNEQITSLGITSNGWHKISFGGQTGYINGKYLSTTQGGKVNTTSYPLTYHDDTCAITVYKQWHENAYVYAAHITFTDYERLWAECARGKYNSGTETTSSAAKRVGAILAINGDYATPGNGAGGYAIARNGKVCNDKKAYPESVYNSYTGLLTFGHSGKMLSELVANKEVTDTFQFGPNFLQNGKIIGDPKSTNRAQRTFIGTNGVAGDIWLCVSDGRYNDGKSSGLNAYQCATYLQSKGCTLGTPLDGGGSSTIYFNGQVLNAAKNGQRSVADFLVFK